MWYAKLYTAWSGLTSTTGSSKPVSFGLWKLIPGDRLSIFEVRGRIFEVGSKSQCSFGHSAIMISPSMIPRPWRIVGKIGTRRTACWPFVEEEPGVFVAPVVEPPHPALIERDLDPKVPQQPVLKKSEALPPHINEIIKVFFRLRQ